MVDLLRFIFSSFWIWLGTVVLLAVVAQALLALLQFAVTIVLSGRKR